MKPHPWLMTAELEAELEAQPAAAAVPEGFRVRDEGSANWLVRKVVEARRYAQGVQAWALRETRRAHAEEAWLLRRFGPQLEDWLRRRLEADRGRRRKSVNLPAGTVGYRTEPPRLDVTDEQQLLRWCKAHLPAAVVTTEHVLKTVVNDHLAATGELADGAEVALGTEKFFVK